MVCMRRALLALTVLARSEGAEKYDCDSLYETRDDVRMFDPPRWCQDVNPRVRAENRNHDLAPARAPTRAAANA